VDALLLIYPWRQPASCLGLVASDAQAAYHT
jgi:hypothetical protein